MIFLYALLCVACAAEMTPRLEISPVQEIQRKPIGKAMIVTCSAKDADPALVTDLQWKDSYNNTIPPNISGQQAQAIYTETLPAGNLALLTNSLTLEMGGKYYCTASYANSEMLISSVIIKPYVAITWTNAPKNQYPILGDEYVVKCEVKADPNPTIDWLRNDKTIRTGDRYVIKTDGLLIRGVRESDDGIYICRATVIEMGELQLRPIRVEVYTRPQITYLPEILESVEGKPFSANCTAIGKPVPEITWIKDDTQQNVALADRFQVNPQTGLLIINSVTQEDFGTYTCIAKNDAGIVDKKTKLNVLVRPSITELFNVTVVHKKEVALTCRAKGRPAPAITFRRWGSLKSFTPGRNSQDDRIILEQFADNDRGESSGTLRITDSKRSDDGLYQCIAQNRGDTAYKTGHITVEFPPSFEHMRDLPPIFSWAERKANLSCLALGIPNATIEWRWNGRQIRELYDKNLKIVGTGPRSDLIVHPIARQYYSVYKCIATNIHGTAEYDIQLKEARVPDFVAEAVPNRLTATSITFNIRGPPTEFGLPITAYSVQYKETINPDWATALNRSWSPDSPYIVEGLQPQTMYNFRFAARNQVGLGNWGAHQMQATPRRSVPEEPKLLHAPVQNDKDDPVVVSPYPDRFELRWNVPADNGEPIDFYRIDYCEGIKMAGVWHDLEKKCNLIEALQLTNSYELLNLRGNAYYRIELRAHNVIGFSSPASIILKTQRGLDAIQAAEQRILSSAAFVGIVVGCVIALLLVIDLLSCLTVRMGVIATICSKTNCLLSNVDEDAKLRSDEKETLRTSSNRSLKQNPSIDYDVKYVHTRGGKIIGKNSAV